MPPTKLECRCPFCQGEARVYEEDRRYRIACYDCGYDGYLKSVAKTKKLKTKTKL